MSSILACVIIGLVIGGLGSRIAGQRGGRAAVYLALSVIGALVAGTIPWADGLGLDAVSAWSALAAAGGAAAMLVTYHAVV